MAKYGNVDDDDIRAKLDAIRQEPRERVQRYFERLDRFFRKGKISDVKQRRRFLAKLRPEIRKLCVVKCFTDIEELVGAATKVERVLGEIGETPFELLKEKQEEGITGMSMKNPTVALINFLEGSMPNPISSFPPALLIECQVYEGRDHTARTCPRLITPWPKCARCGGPHKTESCGLTYPFDSDLGRAEGRYQRKQHEKGSRFGAANFLEALSIVGKAVATVKDRVAERQPVDEFVKMTEVTNVVTGKKWRDAVTPCETPRTETNDARRKQVNIVEDEGCTEAVTATKEVVSVHEEATVHLDRAPLADNETDSSCEGVGGQVAAKLDEIVQDLEKNTTFVTEDINIEAKSDVEMGELFIVVLSTSAVDDDPINQGRMMNGETEQRTQITQIADDLSVVPMQVMCQHPQDHDNSILQTVSRNAYKQDLCVQKFGISISNRLANVEARTLPLPRLKYHDINWEEYVLSIGRENIMNIRMVNGGSIRRWACINYSQCAIARIAPQLCNELIEMCRTSGMVFEMNPMLTMQCAGSEHCDDVRAAVPENNQSFSGMKVVVHSRNIVQDELQETSYTTGLADELKESPRLSGSAEDIHSATSKSKKIIVNP